MRAKLLGSCGVVILAAWLTACGQKDEAGQSAGQATGATCPDDSDVTYESFTRGFMQSYCTRCHSTSLRSSERQGAPSDHNFDTLEGLRDTEIEHIEQQAAGGPSGVNDAMPPTAPKPSDEERRKLGEWLACGMP